MKISVGHALSAGALSACIRDVVSSAESRGKGTITAYRVPGIVEDLDNNIIGTLNPMNSGNCQKRLR